MNIETHTEIYAERPPLCNHLIASAHDKPLKSMTLSLFYRLRRHIRRLVDEEIQLRQEGRALHRKVRKLKEQANPFNHARITSLEAEEEISRQGRHEYSTAIKEAANLLIHLSKLITQLTTLEERFDMLNVNIADRNVCDKTDDTSIVAIAAEYGLEDSAMHRGSDWKKGQLAHAFNKVFIDFLCNTPEGKAMGKTLFEPGGLLESVPTYQTQLDGTIKRMPPKLRVVRNTD